MFIQEKPSKEDIELFDIMFVDFNEKDDVYDNLFDMWIKLPFNEQDDSVKYAENYIKYQKNKKEIPSLFFYLKDKKYNWTTLRK
jgi:hypothetical protein